MFGREISRFLKGELRSRGNHAVGMHYQRITQSDPQIGIIRMVSHSVSQIIGGRPMFSGAIERVGKDQPFLCGTETLAQIIACINHIIVEAIGLFRRLDRHTRHAGVSLPGIAGNAQQQRRSRDFISVARQFARLDQQTATKQHEHEQDDPAHHSPSPGLRNRPRASHRAVSSRTMGAIHSGQVTAEAIGGS